MSPLKLTKGLTALVARPHTLTGRLYNESPESDNESPESAEYGKNIVSQGEHFAFPRDTFRVSQRNPGIPFAPSAFGGHPLHIVAHARR
jgi:hypothetical protein